MIQTLIQAINDIKTAFFFKNYSLLTMSLSLSIPQIFSYASFKAFLLQRVNTEEVILMMILAIIYSLAVFFICLLDILSGLLRSWVSGEKFTNSKFIMGILKLVIYQALIIILLVFQFASHLLGWELVNSILVGLLFIFGVLIVLWEFRSVGVNVETIFGKQMRVFYVLDAIIETIELRFINKIKNSKICQDDEDKK